MSESPDPLEIMRKMYNCPDNVQSITYEDIGHVYFALRYALRDVEELERKLAKAIRKNKLDMEWHLQTVQDYHRLARQYACDCAALCSKDWEDQDYCGWRAKKALGEA